ncbi:hypothetical protein QBC38DRAFT_484983, partial [Podospora fimiseda]
VLDRQVKYEEAEKMHRQALQLFEKVLGKEHPSTLSSMGNLVGVLNDQGKYKEAEQMLDSLEFIIWEPKLFQRFRWGHYDIY